MKTIIINSTKQPVLSELQQALEAAGYRAGSPANLTSWTNTVDASLCGEMVCPSCNHEGMETHAFYRLQDGRTSYRVIAACPVCCTAEEM